MKLYPSQQVDEHIGNHLITAALPQACNVIWDRIPCVVESYVDVRCSSVHRCRCCKLNATLIVKMIGFRSLASWDDWNVLASL